MPLVKKSSLRDAVTQKKSLPQAAPVAILTQTSRRTGRRTSQAGAAAERISAASLELASGIGEAAAAAAELQRTMDQISRGAEDASGAAQESLTLINAMGQHFASSREAAETSKRQAEKLGATFTETNAQIESSVAAIALNAERQHQSVAVIEVLEQRANAIANISRDVSSISDQTSLLALNAALAAARAGDSGRGFSIVADEVRILSETSEADAQQVEAHSIEVMSQVRNIAERIRASSRLATSEAEAGRAAVAKLDAARTVLVDVSEAAQAIAQAAIDAATAAREVKDGAEQVGRAAEQQSAAAAEAGQAVQQQSVSLDQSHRTAEDLSQLVERLRADAAGAALEGISTSAEELSSTVQELSGAANEILVAVEQIGRAAEMFAAATQQSDAAMGQIEGAVGRGRGQAEAARDQMKALQALIAEGAEMVETLTAGVKNALQETLAILGVVVELGHTARRIEKIVDRLAFVVVQINMLAVTGSVESTRAGDAGTGFGTVSSDIRKLSRGAAENAELAKDAVRTMQDQIADLRRILDQNVVAAEAGVSRNSLVASRLQALTKDLDAMGSANDGILTSAETIVPYVGEIRRGTASIASVAEQASAASRQAASAARQQSQGAEQLAAAIEEIASLSNVLLVAKA